MYIHVYKINYYTIINPVADLVVRTIQVIRLMD